MKYAIGLFLILFITTNPAKSQNEGNATQSNESVTIRTEGLVLTISEKGNSTDQEIEVTTVTTVEDSLASNITQEHGQNHSLVKYEDIKEENTTMNNKINEENATIYNTTKEEENETINNTIKDENATIYNTTKVEENTTINNTIKDENATIYNTTKEEENETINNTIKEENATIYNTTKVEENTTINNTIKDVNETMYNTTEEEENTTIYNATKEEMSAMNSTEKTIVKDTITENQTFYDTNPVTTTLKPLEHKNYCQSYTDKLLNSTLSNHAQKLDPLELEDRAISFDDNLLLGAVKSELGLYDGKVTGMSKGKSTGKCIVQVKSNHAILKSTLSFDGAELSYKVKATFVNFGPTVIVRGKFSGSSVELHIAVPKDGGTGEIRRLRVKDTGRLTLVVKGLGPTGSTVGLVSVEMVNVFRLNFRRSIEKELRDAMGEEIKKITYP